MQPGEEYKVLSGGALVNTIGQICRLTRAASLVIFARFLGKEEFGLYFLVWSLTEIVQTLSLLGFETGTLWQASELAAAAKMREIRPTVWRIFAVGTLLGLLSVGAIYFLAADLARLTVKRPELAFPWFIFCLTTPFYIGSRILLGGIRATLKMHYEVLVCYVLEPLVLLTVGWIGLLLGGQLLACVVAHLAASIAGWGLALFFFFHVYPKTNHPAASFRWKTFLSYSLYLGGVNLLQQIKQRLDLIILGRFLTLDLVGIYGALSEIGFVVRKIRNIFDAILLPILSRLRALRDRLRLQRKFMVTLRWVLLTAFGYYGVLWIAPQPILKIFGSGFEVGATALLIFAAGEIVHATLGILECDLQMAGRSDIIFWNWAATLVINFALLYGLIPLFGLNGAAIATAATLTLMGVVRLYQVKRLEGFYPFHRSQGKVLAAAGGSILSVSLLPVGRGAIAIALYLGFFFLFYILLRPELEDREAWGRFKARFRRLF